MYVAGEGVVHVGEILVDDSNDLVFPVVGQGVCLCGGALMRCSVLEESYHCQPSLSLSLSGCVSYGGSS